MKESHFVLASDENYVPHMAANIVSVCESNREGPIVFHILSNRIGPGSVEKLHALLDRYKNTVIEFINCDSKYISERIGVKSLYSDRSLSAYARIFIPDLISQSVERVIYLDCDGIMVHSCYDLLNMHMSYEIYGVKDVNYKEERIAVGLAENDSYICSGMMLMDLAALRRSGFTDACLDFIREHDGKVAAMDQGTINGIFRGKIGLLPPKYDVLTPFYKLDAEQLADLGGWENYYSQEEIDEAVDSPVFIHFTPGYSTRPWQSNCKHPMKDLYVEYRNKTEFPILALQPDKRSAKIKLLSYLYNHIPYAAFSKFMAIVRPMFGRKR